MEFRHHPDGRIYIDDAEITLSDFMIEEPAYTLPFREGGLPPFIGRRYDGTRHVLTDGKNQRAGPVPWPDGEGYISRLATYQANIAARQPVPDPPTRNELIAGDPQYPTHFELVQAVVAKHKGNNAPMDALESTLDALLIKYP